MMIVGRILSPIHALGPGERIGLWTQGCGKGCEGCISPELQPFRGQEINENALSLLLRRVAGKNNCTGLTITGGDPFEQADSLLRLLLSVRDCFADILVYTGFELREILGGCAGEAGVQCLKYIDVLIDGRYIREMNTPDYVLRGSGNQTIHFFNETLRSAYTAYMQGGRIAESFVHGGTTLIVGILDEVKNE